MPVFDLLTLFAAKTAAQILEKSLTLAAFLGLPVTSWQVGDPTRSTFVAQSEHLATLDQNVATYMAGGYLDSATGDWLTVLAEQQYGITRGAATTASGDAVLTNTSAAVYVWDENDLTFKDPTSGKTYKNAEAITLSGVGSTVTFTFRAEEPGSESSTGSNALELLTTVLGVTLTSNTAATGIDEQSDPDLRNACRRSLAALSPNGPADAYRFVATSAELTGATSSNKAAIDEDDDTGTVTVYLSSFEDQVSTGDLVLVEAALRRYALPACITLEIVNAEQISANISGTLTVRQTGASQTEVVTAVTDALRELFRATDIGGTVTTSAIIGTAYAATTAGSFIAFELFAPTDDIVLDADQNIRLDGWLIDVVIVG